MNKRNNHKGFLLAEMIVAMTVLAIILSCLALSMSAFRKINNYQLVRQQCISAAQAQLDSIAAAGRPIGDDDLKRLWPKVNLQIEQSDGTDKWQGMKLVKVRASAKAGNKAVSIELAEFFAPEREIQK
ncbi:MAG: type II secretion system protein [Sedimentisphaerales bacterium]